MNFIHYIPVFTTLFSLYFFVLLYRHWKYKGKTMHVFWWMLGVLFYGAGTVTESINTIVGFNSINFKAWYILGALLGGAPLAQGTVYLLLKKRTADIFSIVLLMAIFFTAILVIFSPLHTELIHDNRMTGKILEWKFIRYITPFINIYAFLFLVGGAVYSALKYAKDKKFRNRFLGNVCIAVGGLLPGIGGSFTKFGYIEVLYVTELVGLLCVYMGYIIIRKDHEDSLHTNQFSTAVMPV